MQKDPLYQHIENVPVKDTTERYCAFYRVFCRMDNMGYRVELTYGNQSEILDEYEATRRARYAVDIRNIDPKFSAVSLEVLQQESRERWHQLRSDRSSGTATVVSIASVGQELVKLRQEYPGYPGFQHLKAAENPDDGYTNTDTGYISSFDLVAALLRR